MTRLSRRGPVTVYGGGRDPSRPGTLKRAPRRTSQAGFTLIEVIIAITLLSAISAGMLISLRGGLLTLDRTSTRIEQERRALGVEEMLRTQIGDVIPATGYCGVPGARGRAPLFRGTPDAMLFATSYSMTEGSRGYPRIAEYQVLPNRDGTVRLVVNETVLSGPASTLPFCLPGGLMTPWAPGPQTFVIAERLQACRIIYRQRVLTGMGGEWKPDWILPNLPFAIRIEMLPAADVRGAGPTNITIQFHISRDFQDMYADQL